MGEEQTRDALPPSFLQEPAENITPAMYIKDVTQAPVMVNRYLRSRPAITFCDAHRPVTPTG